MHPTSPNILEERPIALLGSPLPDLGLAPPADFREKLISLKEIMRIPVPYKKASWTYVIANVSRPEHF